MYLNPKIYEVYSIIVLVISILDTIVGLCSIISLSNNILSFIPGISGFWAVIVVLCTLLSLLSLFFAYVEFSSMYTFGDMITYVQSNSLYPMRKKAFVASPSFYRSFGTAIFIIYFVLGIISLLIMTISDSFRTHYFIALPILPMIPTAISVLLSYVNYYVKYKAFGDLLEISITDEASSAQKDKLAENKPRVLRAYCTVLFVLSIIFLIAVAVILFFIFKPIEALFGTGLAVALTIGIIISALVTFVEIAITGCYFDNLGKMIEHYLIKYKLI